MIYAMLPPTPHDGIARISRVDRQDMTPDLQCRIGGRYLGVAWTTAGRYWLAPTLREQAGGGRLGSRSPPGLVQRCRSGYYINQALPLGL